MKEKKEKIKNREKREVEKGVKRQGGSGGERGRKRHNS
jgi:hypothetical protein